MRSVSLRYSRYVLGRPAWVFVVVLSCQHLSTVPGSTRVEDLVANVSTFLTLNAVASLLACVMCGLSFSLSVIACEEKEDQT